MISTDRVSSAAKLTPKDTSGAAEERLGLEIYLVCRSSSI